MSSLNILKRLVSGEVLLPDEILSAPQELIESPFPIKYVFSDKKYIDRGMHGRVYEIANKNSLAVKVTKEGVAGQSLIKGQEIQAYLEQKGFCVPHTLGMYNVYNATTGAVKLGHVMERINGQSLKKEKERDKIPKAQYNKIKELFEKQQEALYELGLISFYNEGEHPIKNTIWDFENQRLVFIDFDFDKMQGNEFIEFKENKNKVGIYQ